MQMMKCVQQERERVTFSDREDIVILVQFYQ